MSTSDARLPATSSKQQQGVHRRAGHSSSSAACGTGASATKKPNYLELESDYLGELQYDTDIPVPLSDFKHLQYPLASEVFCGYRPTILELQSILQLVTVSDIGPIVDLIDPVAAYPVCIPPAPAPEDAALLIGLIPGVERHLTTRSPDHDAPQIEATSPREGEASPRETPSEQRKRKDIIDTIVDQFDQKSFVHPLKPHLKPTKVKPQTARYIFLVDAVAKVLDVLPNSRLWSNRYIHASLQQVDNVPSEHPLVLKNLEHVSQRLRNFALFEPGPRASTSINSTELHQSSDEMSSTTRLPKSQDELYIEGDYQFVRDYIARFPEDQNLASNLIFDLPVNISNSDSSSSAYFLPLRGPKLLFTRASAAHAAEAKKSRFPLHLSSRPPTDAELQDEKARLEVLRKVEAPISALSSKTHSVVLEILTVWFPLSDDSEHSSPGRSSSTSQSDSDHFVSSPVQTSQQQGQSAKTAPSRQQRPLATTPSSKSPPRRKRIARRKASSESSLSSSSECDSSSASVDGSSTESSSCLSSDESSADSSRS